ncbi:acid protease [Hysterangium stoloniferum]|nr:acid protease [Hysterangium stoloniferum]
MLRAFVILTLSSGYCFASSVQAERGLTATLPITRRTGPSLHTRQKSVAIGLGDNSDITYSVQIQVGDTSMPMLFDPGAADLWAISTDCSRASCGLLSTTPQISASSFNDSGIGIEFDYGSSSDPTSAIGKIVSGPVGIAGIHVQSQFFGAINSTNTSLPVKGVAGIFGGAFPSGSGLFGQLLSKELPAQFTDAQFTDKFISLLPDQAPFLPRLVTLQRETVEVGGNVGQLTIGQLPEGVSNDSLTWVPVRLYTSAQGGLSGPSNNPNQTFPLHWEVPIDDVFLNGQKLPKPTLPAGTGYTALLNPASPNTICETLIPVHLTFLIGGKLFPVDPRDFLGGQTTSRCIADSLAVRDPPSPGGLMSWTFGTVFMKSALVAFYFGNLTNPAADPPRMGFLSTVPSDADAALQSDVQSALTNPSGFLTIYLTGVNTVYDSQFYFGAGGNIHCYNDQFSGCGTGPHHGNSPYHDSPILVS